MEKRWKFLQTGKETSKCNTHTDSETYTEFIYFITSAKFTDLHFLCLKNWEYLYYLWEVVGSIAAGKNNPFAKL